MGALDQFIGESGGIKVQRVAPVLAGIVVGESFGGAAETITALFSIPVAILNEIGQTFETFVSTIFDQTTALTSGLAFQTGSFSTLFGIGAFPIALVFAIGTAWLIARAGGIEDD